MGDGMEGVVTRLKRREGRRGDEEKEVGRQSNDWLVSLNFLVPCAMDLAAGKHDPLAENQTRCGCCVSALETGGFRAHLSHLSHHTSSPVPNLSPGLGNSANQRRQWTAGQQKQRAYMSPRSNEIATWKRILGLVPR